MDKFHLYTHAGCMDGSASAILFMWAGGKRANVHWINAGMVDELMQRSSAVFDPEIPILLVDISPSVDFARFLVARGNVWIIDHHKTAEPLSGMSPNFVVDVENTACGCENFRRWLVSKGYPEMADGCYQRFTRIIDDHDRWQGKIPFALELAKFLAFVGQKDFVDRMMNVPERFSSEREDYWTDFERDMMRLVARIQERKFRATFEKMQVQTRVMLGRQVTAAYVISDEVNNSEMLNLYLKEHPEVDVAIQISFGLQKVSLRSIDKVDVAEVAKQFGGGGHRNAAGHPLPKGMIAEIIDEVHGGVQG
jgi:oligoribonuclease NrnB/cAMP/cGMP phosphodiesterase (DHH superfamily)